PHVFGEVRRDVEVFVFVRSFVAQRELRDRDDLVGVAAMPSVGKHGCRRKVLRIAFDLASIGPGRDGGDLTIAEAWIVRPVPNMRVGLPRRHRAPYYSLPNRGSPGPHFRI